MDTQTLAPHSHAPAPLDESRIDAFAGRMLGVLNEGALALLCSVGHRVGLFDVLDGAAPRTSEEIAASAGLSPRYVREWLAGLVTAGVIEHDPTAGTYVLPPEHAALLTRAAGTDNLAATTQFLALLAQVEDQIIERFRDGGGVDYTAYPRLHQIMAEESGAVHDASLVDVIIPLVPGLTQRLEAGIDVADIGCGRGHAINLLGAAFPASRFVGYDLAPEAVAAAEAEAERLGLTNVTFEVCDVAELDEAARFDLVTAFDAIHDQAHPQRVLAAVARALRSDGTFLMVDIKASSHVHENAAHPLGVFLYTVSCLHCMPVSLAGGGSGLGTMWGEQQARAMLADAGFTSVDVAEIEGDITNYYYVATRA